MTAEIIQVEISDEQRRALQITVQNKLRHIKNYENELEDYKYKIEDAEQAIADLTPHLTRLRNEVELLQKLIGDS